MAKKKKTKLPPDLELLFDDNAQKDALSELVLNEDAGTDVYRAIWRRIFKDTVPPWITTEENREQLEDPGPYAIKSLLTGELCPVCGRPQYLTANHAGVVCAGGHDGTEKKKQKEEEEKVEPEMVAVTIDEDDDFFD